MFSYDVLASIMCTGECSASLVPDSEADALPTLVVAAVVSEDDPIIVVVLVSWAGSWMTIDKSKLQSILEL